MSASTPASERTVKAVLLALWHGGEQPLQRLLEKVPAPLAQVRMALEMLRSRGCLIEESGGGNAERVRLASTDLICWGDVIADVAAREGLRVGARTLAFRSTPSTNDIALQTARADGDSDRAEGLVVVADEQTAGRGRLGHRWMARARQSLLLSVVWRDSTAVEMDGAINRWTLLSGLAAAEAVESVVALACGEAPHISIKWPNDLLIGGKKLAGILVENAGGGCGVVIGIGINVAQSAGDFGPELQGRAVSLYQATGTVLDRLGIAVAFLRALDGHMRRPGDAWIDAWKGRCGMLGQRLRARVGTRRVEGRVLDISPLEGLLLRDDTGGTQFLSAQTARIEEIFV